MDTDRKPCYSASEVGLRCLYMSPKRVSVHFLRMGCGICKLVEAPSNFIAGRPKAALSVLALFGDFRCGVLLFIVILVIYYTSR